jgi:UDP-N-acetylmuramoylalanine--D-glutamate ligase
VYDRGVPLIGGIAALAGKRVAIFGAGTEGRAFARFAGPACAELFIIDDAPTPAPAQPTDEFEVLDASSLADLELDFVVRSPGVSRYDARFVALRGRGVIVTSATALWLEDFQDREVVAVTGSKGKTTTATLTAAALESYGLDVVIAGNIGRPLTELYEDDAHDAFVVELSSFQTADVTVSPTVGVLTLLAPDHLDWHRSIERYYEDKLQLFAGRDDLPVAVNACCDRAVARTSHVRGRRLYGCAGDVTLTEGRVLVGDQGPLDLEGFQLLGEHNLVNACGAVTAARLLTGEPPDLERLAAALVGVPVGRSRLEPIAVVDSVTYVDDALASNPEGTVAALQAFAGRPLAVIVGGQDRGVDFGPLARALVAARPVPVVICIDPAGASIASALRSEGGAVEALTAPSLEEAVKLASGQAAQMATDATGAVVLFSPAAPTPSSEGSYLDRSRRLREAVAALASDGGEGAR